MTKWMIPMACAVLLSACAGTTGGSSGEAKEKSSGSGTSGSSTGGGSSSGTPSGSSMGGTGMPGTTSPTPSTTPAPPTGSGTGQ
jgi:hypothetical protein